MEDCPYKVEDYSWFGRGKNNVPQGAYIKCVMCDYTYLETPKKGTPHKQVCPDCNRKSLKIFDSTRWFFFTEFGLADWELFCDQYGTPYGYFHKDGKTYSLESKTFEAIHRGQNPEAKDKVVNQFLSYCRGLAYGVGKNTLYTRIKRTNGTISLDAGNKQALNISKTGWEAGELPQCTFRSLDHAKNFEVDASGTRDDWLKFKEIFNLENEESRILFEVWCASCFVPSIPHPILVPVGEQGAAKSTLCSLTKNLIDPSVLSILSLPKDCKELILQLQESLVVAYDNITELNDEQTDILCQATTGFSFSKRKLFSDGDSYARNLQSIMILNGINLPTARPDLVDRSIVLELSRLSKDKRKTLEDVQNHAEELMPKARAYLLSVVCKSLQIYPDVKKELIGKLPRMADWAIYAEAISRALGYTSGEFVKAYEKNEDARTEEAIAGDSIASMVIELGKEGWDGTSSDLLQELTRKVENKGMKVSRMQDFPTAPNVLSRKLRILKTTLTEAGISFESKHTGTERKIYLKKIERAEGQQGLGGG